MLHYGHHQTHGRNDVSTCVHASYADAFRVPDVFLCTLGKGQSILLMHLSVSTSYVEQRPAPLRSPASPSPLLSSPDLVYLIDFYPAGHLYNTEQPLHVCMCVCVCVCMCVVKTSMQRVQIGSRLRFLLFAFNFPSTQEM